MPRIRTQAAKDSLLRRVRKQRLKYITVLPSLITILNGVCGFAAIVLAGKAADGLKPFAADSPAPLVALQGQPAMALAGYMILLAMIADMLDGRLARMSQSTSSFGGQLDSLCDIVSFGVAPAFLMLRILEHKLAGFAEVNPSLASFMTRFIWLAAAAYISCAAIRLARFNVENEEDESAHMSFVGLPTPAAAGVLVSLIIFHQAVLMVSRVRYPHVLNLYLKGKKPLAHLIRVLLFLGLIIWSRQAALVLIFCGFALSGFAKWFYYKVLTKRLAGESQMPISKFAE
jgi:CDP-diacylglycerol--serine O-phosphatidyltransferase